MDKALEYFNRAYKIQPGMDFILGDILNVNMHMCLWSNLQSCIDELIQKNKNNMNKKNKTGSKKSTSSSNNIKKNKHKSKNKVNGLDNQTQYSLEIDDKLLSELGDI